MSNAITTIEANTFHDCSKLASIIIPSSVKSIGDQAFYGCNRLSSVTLPNTLMSIGRLSFGNCYALTSITIPSCVTFIDDGAFYSCKNLKEVKSEIPSPFEIDNDVFSGISSVAILYVPQGTIGKYKVLSGWTKQFKEIVEYGGTTTYTLSITSSGNGYVTYSGNTIKNTTKTYTVNEGSSATLTFTPNSGYRIGSVKVNGVNYTSYISNNQFTFNNINKDYTVEVTFEAIPATYTLSITSSGNGYVTYSGNTINGTTSSYTVNEGSSATLTFSPNSGYRVGSVKVNNVDVTSSVSNNRYTISNINKNTTVSVTFEAIPPTTYTVSIFSSGNGYVTYSGTTINGTTKTFTVNSGTSATLTFTPNSGYRVGSLIINNAEYVTSISDNKYTISNITKNTTVSVTFEAIPPATYGLMISSTGNGYVTYSGNTINGALKSFTVSEGASATLTFTPNSGYRVGVLKVNGVDVTSSISNNKYTISNINRNTTVSVTFEEIPQTTTYTLSITSSVNGTVTYSNTTINGTTKSFSVNKGSSATLTFTPNSGYRIVKVMVNDENVTSNVSNKQYTISNISQNTTVIVKFEDYDVKIDGIYYNLNTNSKTAEVTYTTLLGIGRSYSGSVNIPQRITYDGISYSVCSIGKGAFSNCWDVTSVSMPNSITTIELSAFSMTGISSIIIPNGVTIIGDAAFMGCSYLTSVIISNSVTNIGLRAFDGCSKLSSITIPNSVTSIGKYVFYGCNSLKDVRSEITNPFEIDVDVFYNIPTDARLHVPQGTINKYKALTGWTAHFKEIVEYGGTITYSLSITSSGSGYVTFAGTTINGTTKSFTVNSGASATLTFTPNSGYRVGSLKVNNVDVTSSISNNKYTISNITKNTTVNVTFEAIPVTTYSLSITSSGSGYVSYSGTTINSTTKTFTINSGASATLTFTPNSGYRVGSLKVNNVDVTSNISNSQYTISSINKNTTVNVTFEVIPILKLTYNGVNYSILSHTDHTANVANGSYGQTLEVPASFVVDGVTWKVRGIDNDVITSNPQLAAIIWNPSVIFNISINNPNFLLYVTSANYATQAITNVIVNGTANKIVLTEAANGNDFYCPRTFTAMSISYTHNYSMTTGINESRGWETIALPFDVQTIKHATKGEIVPFAKWSNGDSRRPFWLYQLTSNGWSEADGIKAYTPYVISMPNNDQYYDEVRLNGNVTFSATNVRVEPTIISTATYQGKTFTTCFSTKAANTGIFALNVKNQWASETNGQKEGSTFVQNLRTIHPFEAYMTITNTTRSSFEIFEDMTTGIRGITELMDLRQATGVYNLKGQKIKVEDDKKMSAGIYIINGQKVIVK